MRKLFLCFFFSCLTLYSQGTSNPIVDAFILGHEQRMRREQRELDRQVERERLELEKQVQQEKIRQMQQETELLKTETNLLKGETESLKSGRAPSQQEQELEVAASLLELQKRYPDLADYLPRMSQATEFFQMQGAISMEDYLEGLYAISKYSSFMSRDKSKIKIPTELPESQPDKKHRAQEDKDEAPPTRSLNFGDRLLNP